MKTSTRVLMAVGAICACIPLFMKDIAHISDAVDGFLKGFGITVMVGGILLHRWRKEQKTAC